jgi:hypothetical protein
MLESREYVGAVLPLRLVFARLMAGLIACELETLRRTDADELEADDFAALI